MKLNLFESDTGELSTWRGMLPFIAGLALLALTRLDWPAALAWVTVPLIACACTLFFWFLANLAHIILAQRIERARLRAEALPMNVQIKLVTDQTRQQTDLIRELRGLDPERVELAKQLNALPEITIEPGRDGYAGVGVFLALNGLRIPGAFCAAWLAALNARGDLPPVRLWNGSERTYAVQIIDALAKNGAAVENAGNQSARWIAGLTVESQRHALNKLGVLLAAAYYQQEEEQAE